MVRGTRRAVPLADQSKDKQFYLWLKMHTPTERPNGGVLEISEAEQTRVESAWADPRGSRPTRSDGLVDFTAAHQSCFEQLGGLRA